MFFDEKLTELAAITRIERGTIAMTAAPARSQQFREEGATNPMVSRAVTIMPYWTMQEIQKSSIPYLRPN